MSSPRVEAPAAPAPAAVLRAERLQRGALDEAVAGDGHHHLARLDQAFVVLIGQRLDDVGHARRGELLARLHQFLAHHFHAPRMRAEDVQQLADLGRDLVQVLRGSSRAPGPVRRCRRISRMPRACSSVRRTVSSALITLPGSSIRASSGADIGGGPVALHQGGACGGGVGAGADQADHLVDVRDRDGEPDQRLCAVCAPCSSSKRARRTITSSRNADEAVQRVLQPQLTRLAACPAPAC